MSKDLITNKTIKILYEELNNYLKTKEQIPNIINISIGNDYASKI